MTTYRLSPLAESDLEDIWLYTLNKWSIGQADSYLSQIMNTMEDLAAERKQGRPVDLRDGYLKLAVGKHLIFFRRLAGMVHVIRVLHQRMDADQQL